MASSSETGHYRNISYFEQLIQFCVAYGVAYNPSNPDLTTANLTIIYNSAFALHQAIPVAQAPYTLAVNSRQERFEQLPAFASRIVSALSTSAGVTPELKADAKAILRKIRGKRLKAVDPEATTVNSVAQLSYDLQYDHFSELIALVAAVPSYNPNEADIQITNLNIAKAALLSANQQVGLTRVPLSNARLARNAVLYDGPTSLVQRAFDVKVYVKSIFGPSSPQYKQISGFRFTRYNP